jgi:hypothetical protein
VKQIKTYIDQIASISDKDWQIFSSKLQRRVIPKKTTFLKINDVERKIEKTNLHTKAL